MSTLLWSNTLSTSINQLKKDVTDLNLLSITDFEKKTLQALSKKNKKDENITYWYWGG
jgi:hypothetical protein